MAAKLTLADRRSAWVTEVFGSITPDFTVEEANVILDRIEAEGPELGKSPKWAAAVRWFADERQDGADENWIVMQGSVYLTHAL